MLTLAPIARRMIDHISYEWNVDIRKDIMSEYRDMKEVLDMCCGIGDSTIKHWNRN